MRENRSGDDLELTSKCHFFPTKWHFPEKVKQRFGSNKRDETGAEIRPQL